MLARFQVDLMQVAETRSTFLSEFFTYNNQCISLIEQSHDLRKKYEVRKRTSAIPENGIVLVSSIAVALPVRNPVSVTAVEGRYKK